MTWKPDFNSTDPFGGMPEDYLGKATFIPTVQNPVAPWGEDFDREGEVYNYGPGGYTTGGLFNTGFGARNVTEQLRAENEAVIKAAALAGGDQGGGVVAGGDGTRGGVGGQVVEVPGLDEIAAMFEQYWIVMIILLLVLMMA